MDTKALKVGCTVCGDVVVGSGAVTLVVGSERPPTFSYTFTCPRCDEDVVRRANRHEVRLLLANGAPVRMTAPERVPWTIGASPPPIEHDDLIDFHRLLLRDDWFDLLTPAGDGCTRTEGGGS